MPDQVNQEELLEEFWETAHKTYFRPLFDQDKAALTYIRSNILTENQEIGLSLVPVFYDEASVDAIVSLLSSKYEGLYGPGLDHLSKHNFANMTKQYYLSMYYYLPLLLGDKDVGLAYSDSHPTQAKYDSLLQEKVLSEAAAKSKSRVLPNMAKRRRELSQ